MARKDRILTARILFDTTRQVVDRKYSFRQI